MLDMASAIFMSIACISSSLMRRANSKKELCGGGVGSCPVVCAFAAVTRGTLLLIFVPLALSASFVFAFCEAGGSVVSEVADDAVPLGFLVRFVPLTWDSWQLWSEHSRLAMDV